MCFVPRSGGVTNRNLLIGKLRIKSGCKGFTLSLLLQASYRVIRNVTLKGGDLLTQNPNQQECCEEFILKFNIIQLFVDVKFKQRVISTI